MPRGELPYHEIRPADDVSELAHDRVGVAQHWGTLADEHMKLPDGLRGPANGRRELAGNRGEPGNREGKGV
jgi:hypothetical protein